LTSVEKKVSVSVILKTELFFTGKSEAKLPFIPASCATAIKTLID